MYIAREGDKLWNIAKKYNTTIDDIAEINEIKADEQLTAGQCLIIEKKTLIEA
ncbi:lysM domain protein [[Clostridium] sordellii ATCC 9714]|nr:lysM domain protein [[Clostridium] sordellii ATCC 9714] [Paeniclostridium sordellii ATCC 9714]